VTTRIYQLILSVGKDPGHQNPFLRKRSFLLLAGDREQILVIEKRILNRY
jgi:hypothetical protein